MESLVHKCKVGDKFGDWTVLEVIADEHTVKCICTCGTTQKHRASKLMNGISRGCKKCVTTRFASFNISDKDTNKYPVLDEDVSKVMQKKWLKENKC